MAIVTEKRIRASRNYKPFPHQLPCLRAYDNGTKRAVRCVHRRGGKDITEYNWSLGEMTEIPGTYFYVWPTLKQGRDDFWEGKDEQGNNFIDYYTNPDVIIKKDNQDMVLEYMSSNSKTSKLQVIGTENKRYLTMRGAPARGIIFTEYAFMAYGPQALDVVRPMIRKTGGWIHFVSTPFGKNHFWEMFSMAKRNREYYWELFPVTKTKDWQGNPLLSEADIEKDRKEGMPEERIQQEYYCSFIRGIEGSYYGKLLNQAEADGRITRIPYDSALPVHTAWDLGYGDYTAIWFFQRLGKEIRLIDYFEDQGEGLNYYAKILGQKPYTYGEHYGPFDIKVHELTTGASRFEMAQKLGIHFNIVDEDHNLSFDDGIQAARSIFSMCSFDEQKCNVGIHHLESYSKKWNEQLQCYTDKAVHDEHSHGADAFRYLSIAIRQEEEWNADYHYDDETYPNKCNKFVGV